jgi:two-component system, OmpR family, response regulator
MPALPMTAPTLAHIAVLDDEPDITTLLATYLGQQGYRVSAVHSGAALLALLHTDAPALVLLDLGLPGEDGLAIARQLRTWAAQAAHPLGHGLGLVIVTGRGDAVDKVVGLEIGADDYITKPFDLRELLARVKAVLRRVQAVATAPPAVQAAVQATVKATVQAAAASLPAATAPSEGQGATALHFAGYVLHTASHQLMAADGNQVALSAGEYELLLVFVTHPGRVLSRDFLLSQSRGREATPFDRTIDVQVGRLRKKLEADVQAPTLLKSVRGAGYLLAVPVVAGAAP